MFRDRVLQHYRTKGYALRERVKVRGQSGAVHACDLVAQGPLGNLIVQFEDYGGFEGPELESVRRIARDVGAVPVIAAEHVGDTIRRHADRNGVVILDANALTAPAPREVLTATTGGEYPPWPAVDRPHRPRTDGDKASNEPTRATTTSWPSDGTARPKTAARMDPGDVDELVTEWSTREEPRHTRREDPGFWQYNRKSEATPKKSAAAPASSTADATNAAVATATHAEARAGFGWLHEQQETASPQRKGTAAHPENGRRSTEAHIRPPPVLLHNVDAFVAPVRSTRDVSPGLERRPETARRTMLRSLAGYAIAGAAAGAAFLGIGLIFGAF